MTKSVKIWMSLLLVSLAAYTLYSMIWISGQLGKQRDGEEAAASTGVDGDGNSTMPPADPVDLGAFQMTSQSAEPFAFDELKGKVWIASLFFSSCPHECKSLNQTISALNRDPDFKDVQFVSVSVDPDVDSPQTLAEYAALFDADPDKWFFLTSDLPQVQRFGRAIDVPAAFKSHSRSLVLVDKQGKPRGQFRYNDAADIARLKAELPEVLAEPDSKDSSAGPSTSKTEPSKATRGTGSNEDSTT